jgi:hypothetical protein
VPTWAWLLLALGVVAAALVIALVVVRSRRRGLWRSELADAEREVAWYAHDLLPTLQQARSPEELRGAWGVGQGRVTTVEQHLAALTESARTDADRARARDLHEAVERAQARIAQVVSGAAPDAAGELALAATELDTALQPSPLS